MRCAGRPPLFGSGSGRTDIPGQTSAVCLLPFGIIFDPGLFERKREIKLGQCLRVFDWSVIHPRMHPYP
jgi:hypothetical protein